MSLTITLNDGNFLSVGSIWPRGGMATQRTANPRIPVRFRARPQSFYLARVMELDIHEGLKIPWEQSHASSSLAPGTNYYA